MTMLVNLSRRFLSLFFLCGILCLVNGARPSRLGAQLGMWRNVPTGCAAAATALARTNISPSGQGFWSRGEIFSCLSNSSSLRSTLSSEYKSGDFQFINRILKPKYAAKCNEGRSGVPRNFVRGKGSTNSVEDRGQRERESGDGSPPNMGFWRQL
jgi:hypothetical protein